MAPESLTPSPFPPSSSDPSFPPASSLPPRKSGLRSAARCPVAKVSPRSSVSLMPVPSLSPQEVFPISIRIPPLPSSASGPGGCPSEQVSLPARADLCPPADLPCLDEPVLGAELGVVDGEGVRLPVGVQNGVRVGFRSCPFMGDAHRVDFEVNSLQGGPPDSQVHALPSGIQSPSDSNADLPADIPPAVSGSLEAHPNSIVEMLPPEISMVHGSLGSHLIRPIPSPISAASVETNPAA